MRQEFASVRSHHDNAHRALKHAEEEDFASAKDMHKRQELAVQQLQRRLDSDEARLVNLATNAADSIFRTSVSQELQGFKQTTVDVLDFKLDRCVQWLYGANVKLGLGSPGARFSTARFKDQLFSGMDAELPRKSRSSGSSGHKRSSSAPRPASTSSLA